MFSRSIITVSLLFFSLTSKSITTLVPAYNTALCPQIPKIATLGPQIYDYSTPYSSRKLNGLEATQTLIDILKPWVYRFESANDLILKNKNTTVCVGLYNDLTSPNAFAYGTNYLMMGLAMAAQLEDLPSVSGKISIQLVMAHEFAHFLQNQYGMQFNYPLPMLSTKMKEGHADCVAGFILSAFENYPLTDLIAATSVLSTLSDRHIVGDHGVYEQRTEALWFGASKGLSLKNTPSLTAWTLLSACSQRYH